MKRFVFPREVLLVEVGRRCGEPVCGARVRLSLTKAQARTYTGFECERCGRWYADALYEQDIPEWWEELNVASLRGLKPERASLKPKSESAPKQKSAPRNIPPMRKAAPKPAPRLPRVVKKDDEVDEPEAVVRLSEEWRRLGRERESSPDVAEDERGNRFE